MKNDHLFETTLVLSTGHMPKSQPDFGGLRTTEHEYGWVVWLSDAAEVPEWIQPALNYARISSCSMVIFDRDAPEADHLQLWDW